MSVYRHKQWPPSSQIQIYRPSNGSPPPPPLPHPSRAIWIQEEKELLQEVAGMGELREPWHTKQVELLDRHLHLLHLYSQAKENLAALKGKDSSFSILSYCPRPIPLYSTLSLSFFLFSFFLSFLRSCFLAFLPSCLLSFFLSFLPSLGSYFKRSSRRNDRTLEFAPLNLHLQRIWVHNDTLNKCGFYDFITVGAFTAHSHKSKNGGLIR